MSIKFLDAPPVGTPCCFCTEPCIPSLESKACAITLNITRKGFLLSLLSYVLGIHGLSIRQEAHEGWHDNSVRTGIHPASRVPSYEPTQRWKHKTVHAKSSSDLHMRPALPPSQPVTHTHVHIERKSQIVTCGIPFSYRFIYLFVIMGVEYVFL